MTKTPKEKQTFCFYIPPGWNRRRIEKLKREILEVLNGIDECFASDYAKARKVPLGVTLQAFEELRKEGRVLSSFGKTLRR